MSMSPPLPIIAAVDEAEQPAFAAATAQLHAGFAAAGQPRRVELALRPAVDAIELPDRPTVVIASLLPALARQDQPWAQTAGHWQAQVARLAASGNVHLFLCTVFRHVPRDLGEPRRSALVERIGRLNLLAVELSHDSDATVIDIDRAFAHIGARRLETDYRLAGPTAAEIAGRVIVTGILFAALDDMLPPELQEAVRRHLRSWQEAAVAPQGDD